MQNSFLVSHRNRDYTNKSLCYVISTLPSLLKSIVVFYQTIVRLSADHTNTGHGHSLTIRKRLTFYDELHNAYASAPTVITQASVSMPNLIIIAINSKLLDQGV